MFGRIYNLTVAVCAVTLLCAIVFGALFIVVQGLIGEFLGVDMWTPVAEALAPLGEDLAELGRLVWSLATELAEFLWEHLTALLDGGGEGGGED